MPGVSRSPRLARARARRIAGGLAFVALIAAASPLPARAFSDPKIAKAHRQLRKNWDRIHSNVTELRRLQLHMNTLATDIFDTQQKIIATRTQMTKLRAQMGPLHKRLAILKAQLGERAREAYIMGPATPMLYVLTATSAVDAANRISMLSEVNRRDSVIATKIVYTEQTLARARDTLARSQVVSVRLIGQLAAQRAEMKKKMAESRRLLKGLRARRVHILSKIVSTAHPFAVCPVDGPHAVTNNFGVLVHQPKKWGGNHIHQGDDIMSPEGTPIVAPFDGVAEVDTNKAGGNGVKVTGELGFVYNAHLSRFGTLGTVTTGTVIGYVGSTGDASGPHDHFEWHPNDSKAVDPYDFLMQVC